MEQITCDLIPGGKMPLLHASQYDEGREYRINLTENKQAYTLDGTELLSISVRKGDNTLFTADIANTFGGKSYVDFVSTEQMCAVAGFSFGELSITKNNTRIGTINFTLMVEPSPEQGGVSQSEINNLRRQVNEMVDDEMGDYLLKTEAEETYATITDLETLSGVVDTKASASDLETLAGVVDTKASKTYVDNAVSPKADKTYVDTELNTKADKSDTYTKAQVDEIIDNLPEPMIFKGTLGVGGTIQTLPTASADNEGFTYKVITAGTYAGISAKVGDVFTSNGSEWVLIPSGDEDSDTWRAIKINGVEKLGNGISSGSVDIVEGDNINVTFDGNGNKVEIEADTIDDTQALNNKSWSSKKTYDEIVNILPNGTASGSIANFNTSLALPMEIEAEFGADVGGVSNIELAIFGSNLWDEQWEVGAYVPATGLPMVDTTRIRSKNRIMVNPNATYYSTQRIRFFEYNENDEFITEAGVYSSGAFTVGSTTKYIRFQLTTTYGTTYLNNEAINYNNDTEYKAYNTNSNILSIPFGSAYYNGGKLTIDKEGHRTLTADGQTVTLPDGEPINALVGTNNAYTDSGDIAVTYKKSIDDAIAELQALILS